MKLKSLFTFILVGIMSISSQVFSEEAGDLSVSSALAESNVAITGETTVNSEALSTSDMESSFYESMSESGSLRPSESTRGVLSPSFDSVERKTIHFKMNDSLWQSREIRSSKEGSEFMMDTIKVFDAPTLQSTINQSFREYLQKQNILVKSGADAGELSKWTFSKEDYVDDFKAHSDKFDVERFVNKKEAIAEHIMEQRLEKLARAQEKFERGGKGQVSGAAVASEASGGKSGGAASAAAADNSAKDNSKKDDKSK